ncbi:hypothetical protein SAMN05192551_106153 [Tindallia magadiensis]|uniref:Tetratricopeptide repeat-containing protein n=1 Tax=Tindallia magadiensis TaxID=69895 RepID=A0A1I3FG58_9FIRM|nr:hypothetical protein [Tindallia magadiensis]SFI10209.1 hypothetical protein SAMN05192551_106153 [Tindallia magadiensis]
MVEARKKTKHAKGIEVIGNPIINRFLTGNMEIDKKSKQYKIQTLLGFLGIALVFSSFRYPPAFFLGAGILFFRRGWRKKTDRYQVCYQDAQMALKKKNYQKCIENLESIRCDSPKTKELLLVQASCYLELENTKKAYRLYTVFFQQITVNQYKEELYSPAEENALLLALEEQDMEFAKGMIQRMLHLQRNDAILAPLIKRFQELGGEI